MDREQLRLVGRAHNVDRRLIKIDEYTVLAEQYGVGGFLKLGAEARLPLLDRGLRLLAFADVAHARDMIVGVGEPQVFGRALHRKDSPVFAAVQRLDEHRFDLAGDDLVPLRLGKGWIDVPQRELKQFFARVAERKTGLLVDIGKTNRERQQENRNQNELHEE